MTRPRIRTVKPEMRQDERYGRLSIPARELFNGLITMADDEGRLRALPNALLGHVFPYDADAPRRLAGWLAEIVEQRMMLRYQVDGVPYLAFRHWRRHQKINRATPSELPPPPDPGVVAANAVPTKGTRTTHVVSDHDSFTEYAVNDHDVRMECASLPRGSGPVRSDPEETDTSQGAQPIDARATGGDERLRATVGLLRQCPRLTFDLELIGVSNVLAMYPRASHERAARLAVSRATDPSYRTTNAARALEFAFADLAKRGDTEPPAGRSREQRQADGLAAVRSLMDTARSHDEKEGAA